MQSLKLLSFHDGLNSHDSRSREKIELRQKEGASVLIHDVQKTNGASLAFPSMTSVIEGYCIYKITRRRM